MALSEEERSMITQAMNDIEMGKHEAFHPSGNPAKAHTYFDRAAKVLGMVLDDGN